MDHNIFIDFYSLQCSFTAIIHSFCNDSSNTYYVSGTVLSCCDRVKAKTSALMEIIFISIKTNNNCHAFFGGGNMTRTKILIQNTVTQENKAVLFSWQFKSKRIGLPYPRSDCGHCNGENFLFYCKVLNGRSSARS